MDSKTRFLLSLMVLSIILYANFVTNSFTFEPFYSLYPDNSELYFLHSLHNQALFNNDLFVKNFKNSLSMFSNEYFFIAIYSLLLNFLPLPLAVKILSVLLSVASVFIIFKISIKYFSREFAFFPAVLFLIYFLCMDTFFGGTVRAFGILSFLTFLYFFDNKKIYILPVLATISSMFYPYLIIPFFIICIMQIPVTGRDIYRKIIYAFWLILNFGVCIFFTLGRQAGYFYRVALSNIDAVGSYKYTLRVDSPINPQSFNAIISYFIFNLNEHSKLYLYYTAFFFSLSLIILIAKKKNTILLPKSFLLVFFACMAAFFLLYPVHPVLASRQLSFIIPLSLVFFISLNLYKIFKNKNILVAFFTFIAVSFLILHPYFNSVKGYGKYSGLYEYVKSLPTGSLIAGNPKSELMRPLPFFTKRSIFFSEKLFFHRLAYRKAIIKQRVESLLRALYLQDHWEVSNFILLYDIDYFIIEEAHYKKLFFEELNSSIRLFDKQMADSCKNLNYHKSCLLDFAKNHYDFKESIDGHPVYIVNARALINKFGRLEHERL